MDSQNKTQSKILSLVRNSSYTLDNVKNYFRQISKPQKSTQALSVFRKGAVCIYIKCLIVDSQEVIIERRSRKKGHCLLYQFECYREFGNASDEEAPPAPLRNKDLSKNMQMQIVAMIQGMENDGSLQRESVTAITKRFSMACCTVHCLWKRVVGMCATGIINSLEFNSQKKIWEATYLSYGVCS